MSGSVVVAGQMPVRQTGLRRLAARSASLLLVVLALVFAGFDAFVVRPETTALARTGRAAIGTVLPRHGAVKGPPHRSSSSIAVDDPELGAQLVDGDASVGVGAPVALLCSTSVGRCERRALVDAYVERWPFTPAMIRAAAMLALGAVGLAVSRRARRRP